MLVENIISNLLTSFKYDNAILQEAINRTFENRQTSYNADTMFFKTILDRIRTYAALTELAYLDTLLCGLGYSTLIQSN